MNYELKCHWLLHTVSNPGDKRMKSRGYIKDFLLALKKKNVDSVWVYLLRLSKSKEWQPAHNNFPRVHQGSRRQPVCPLFYFHTFYFWVFVCLFLSLSCHLEFNSMVLINMGHHFVSLSLSPSLSLAQMELWFNRHDSTGTRLPECENKQTNQ